MTQDIKINCNVDICFAIDCTGSMEASINNVRKMSLDMHKQLEQALEEKQRPLENLRMKVVVFRDIDVDGKDAFEETRFFNIPQEYDQFQSFVNKLEAFGGGDEPESGLEGLSIALNSDWCKEGTRKRHIVVLFTDATTHKLGTNRVAIDSKFKNKVAKDYQELGDMWMDPQGSIINQSGKRLIIYAPDCEPWSNIQDDWGGLVIHCISKAGDGCEEHTVSEICNTVAGSV